MVKMKRTWQNAHENNRFIITALFTAEEHKYRIHLRPSSIINVQSSQLHIDYRISNVCAFGNKKY